MEVSFDGSAMYFGNLAFSSEQARNMSPKNAWVNHEDDPLLTTSFIRVACCAICFQTIFLVVAYKYNFPQTIAKMPEFLLS